jgi:hypothetical protein
MLDERLGRHSVVVASLGLIPGLLVVAMFADGIANPGVVHRRVVVWAFFTVAPVAALVLGLLNGYSLLRAVMLASAALVMFGVWYALLVLPAATLCSAMHNGSCM